MEKEGSALADRPRSIAAGELLCKGLAILFLRSGERLRRYRKAALTLLQPKAVKSYRDIQLEHAKNLMTDILNDPKNHRAHVQR
jgi:cytochrome P450